MPSMWPHRVGGLIVSGLVLLGAGPTGPGPAPTVEGRLEVLGVAQPRHDLRLGFALGGTVSAVLAQPGDVVDKGSAIVRIEDGEARALVALYSVRAAGDAEVLSEEAQWKLAQVEEARIRDAFEKGAAGSFEVERAQLTSRRAELMVRLAEQRRAEARAQLEQATLRLSQYTLAAPIAGRVEEVLVAPGELVEALRPVVRLVVTDPLRIEARVPTEGSERLAPGQEATVELGPEEGGSVRGRIVHVAQVADAASGTRLVRIDVPNPEGRAAGREVRVVFDWAR